MCIRDSYSIQSLLVSMFWFNFTALQNTLIRTYHFDDRMVNILTMMVSLLFVPGSVLSNYMFEQKSLRAGVLLVGLFNLLGTGSRLAIDKIGYPSLVIGQFFIGLATPVIINGTTKLTGDWFSPASRGIFTTISLTANQVGIILGYAVPGLIVNTNELDKKVIEQQMFKLNLIFTIICLVAFILAIFLFRSKPPSPPSLSAAQRETKTFWESFKRSLLNKEYVLHLGAYALNSASFNGFSGVLSQLIRPFGYGDADAGSIGVILNFSGLLGMVLVMPLASRPSSLRFGAISMGIIIVSGFLAWQRIIAMNLKLAMFVAVFFVGFCFGGVWPLSAELASEVNYPISEDFSFGMMGALGNFLGIVQFGILSHLLGTGDYHGSNRAFITITVFLVISFILFLVNKYPLRRLKAESGQNEDSTKSVA
eukprot:TRINITY_DN7205_c0_g1_i6.p1 TRINITY_DN7205_c0_g1~~TRINITY_DN7205_c0_g1_i6.p1  ORF type:complete len:423 (+),score=62.55 TRINITY_DN7205_c0_g1_i6:65-1333(+)